MQDDLCRSWAVGRFPPNLKDWLGTIQTEFTGIDWPVLRLSYEDDSDTGIRLLMVIVTESPKLEPYLPEGTRDSPNRLLWYPGDWPLSLHSLVRAVQLEFPGKWFGGLRLDVIDGFLTVYDPDYV